MENKYIELLQAIIDKQISLIGVAVVVRRARAAGLEVTDEGTVTNIKGDAVEVVRGLVQQFANLSGPVGVMFCKQAAEPTLKKYFDLKVPAELK